MIRAIIIDDEQSAINVLTMLLQNNCKELVEVTATTTFPAEGIKLIERLSPDLVFLDIEMPGMSGIELLRSFVNPTFRVVFVTAYDAYAVEAFHLSAVDYLLKPVEAADLINAVQKIKKDMEINQNPFGAQFHHLEQLLMHNAGTEPKIGINMADRIVFINIHDILYCEANGSYTNVWLGNEKKMVASKSLCEFELQLTEHNFFRVHNSFLINLNRVKEFQRHEGGYVIMENGSRIEVSQRKRKDFLAVIHDMVI